MRLSICSVIASRSVVERRAAIHAGSCCAASSGALSLRPIRRSTASAAVLLSTIETLT